MAYEGTEIIKLFRRLPLEEKEDLLKELGKMTEADRKAPKKSYLEAAWAKIQREIDSLSRYPYVDDQLEIDEIYDICEEMIFEIGSDYMKKDGAKIYKVQGKMDKYYEYTEQHLDSKKAPYMELIEYYRNTNPDKAVQIAELGLKKCRDDQTDLFIFLLQYMRQTGDKEKYAKLLKSARLRRAADQAKIQEKSGIQVR